MIRITVSFDSNYVEIDDDTQETSIKFIKVKDVDMTLRILEESLNVINKSDIVLVKINEGRQIFIGEW